MSHHSEDDDSSFDEEDDQDWGDWVDDNDQESGLVIGGSSNFSAKSKTTFHALFVNDSNSTNLQEFATANEAIAHAASLGCNLLQVIKRSKLDTLQIIRLINYLRRQVVDSSISTDRANPNDINALKGNESFLERYFHTKNTTFLYQNQMSSEPDRD